MEKLILFLKIIAWVAGIFSTVAFALSVYLNFQYPGSIDELIDKARGIKRTYPIMHWLIIMVISFAFIIAF